MPVQGRLLVSGACSHPKSTPPTAASWGNERDGKAPIEPLIPLPDGSWTGGCSIERLVFLGIRPANLVAGSGGLWEAP